MKIERIFQGLSIAKKHEGWMDFAIRLAFGIFKKLIQGLGGKKMMLWVGFIFTWTKGNNEEFL